MTGSISLGSSFVLGVLHALEPGHGKSFLASYTLGEKMQFKEILKLGGSMLLSHFLLLTILAVIFQYALSGVTEEHFLHIKEWGMPFFVIGFGIFLLLRYRKHKKQGIECDCGMHHGPHEPHAHSIAPGIQNRPMNPVGPTLQVSAGELKYQATPVKQKNNNPLLAGLISGLVPCPSVFAPLSIAALAGDFSIMLTVLLVYVLGMSLVMTALVTVFYFTKDFILKKMDGLSSKIDTRLVAAVMVIIVGIGYLGMNFFEHAHHVH